MKGFELFGAGRHKPVVLFRGVYQGSGVNLEAAGTAEGAQGFQLPKDELDFFISDQGLFHTQEEALRDFEERKQNLGLLDEEQIVVLLSDLGHLSEYQIAGMIATHDLDGLCEIVDCYPFLNDELKEITTKRIREVEAAV